MPIATFHSIRGAKKTSALLLVKRNAQKITQVMKNQKSLAIIEPIL